MRSSIAPRFEVVGALAYMPTRSRPLRDGRPGTVGLIDFSFKEPRLSYEDILEWIIEDLTKHLTPYPGWYVNSICHNHATLGPCSVVVFDNMPSHRATQGEIEAAINAKGAIVIWNPARSPDLNPIEKLWDVICQGAARRIGELLVGGHGGVSRGFGHADFTSVCANARLSLKAFSDILDWSQF